MESKLQIMEELCGEMRVRLDDMRVPQEHQRLLDERRTQIIPERSSLAQRFQDALDLKSAAAHGQEGVPQGHGIGDHAIKQVFQIALHHGEGTAKLHQNIGGRIRHHLGCRICCLIRIPLTEKQERQSEAPRAAASIHQQYSQKSFSHAYHQGVNYFAASVTPASYAG